MTKRIVLLVVLGAILCSTQAWAGWVWIQHDYSIPDPLLDDSGNATAQVKQDEYRWVDDGYDDPYGYAAAPGMYLYTYTITNIGPQTLTSFGFLAPLEEPGILIVRAGADAAAFGFAPVDPTGADKQPYWVVDPALGGGFLQGQGSEGFQVIAWGAPRVWATAGVDSNDRVIASGLTTAPTPEPASSLLLVASACGLYGFLRRRRE